MTPKPNRAIHDALDGGPRPPAGSEEEARLREYEETLGLLGKARAPAPPDLAQRVMDRLPSQAGRRFGRLRDWLPVPRQWLVPALAGAALAVLALSLMTWLRRPSAPTERTVNVHFELHAPAAQRVELAGTFNHWQPGTMCMQGPDASGHWEATVNLPLGRYEYQFLIDGHRWVTDPTAVVVRPDGFGSMNAVLAVSGKGTTL